MFKNLVNVTRGLGRLPVKAAALLGIVALGLACSKRREDPAPQVEAQGQVAAAAGTGGQASTQHKPDHAPVGPDLIVYPGKGVGPVRFGAYPETIERLLRAPCDYQTETRCIHFDRALDLTLEGGVLSKIRVERPEHLPLGLGAQELGKNAGRTYGTFRGRIEPKIGFGLHKHIVEEEFGKPKSEETFEPKGATGLVARAHYDYLVLEYDRIENGNSILSAMELEPNPRSLEIMAKARAEKAAAKAPSKVAPPKAP
jgi:hypothetical protein